MPITDKSSSSSSGTSAYTWVRVSQRAPRYTSNFSDYQVVSSGGGTAIRRSTSKTWQSDSEFRKLKASGAILPDRPYSFSELNYAVVSGIISGPEAYSDYTYRTQYRYTNVYFAAPAVSATLSASALYSKLHDKAKGASVNAPVFIAEARQTSQMVHTTALRLVEAARMLRRGNVSGFVDRLHLTYTKKSRSREIRRWNRYFARDQFRSFSKIWLEARYGWLPFYSEVYNFGRTLNELQDQPDNLWLSVSARSTSTRVVTSSNVAFLTVGADGNLTYSTVVDTIKEECRVTWRYMPTTLDGLGRFGLTNPLEVAWELVPFSFVADWFLPIGSYLSQLDLQQRFSHVGGSVGRRIEVSRVATGPKNYFISGGGTAFTTFPSLQCSRVDVTRSPLLSIPMTSLSELSWDPQVNAKRAFDSIALFQQQIRRFA